VRDRRPDSQDLLEPPLERSLHLRRRLGVHRAFRVAANVAAPAESDGSVIELLGIVPAPSRSDRVRQDVLVRTRSQHLQPHGPHAVLELRQDARQRAINGDNDGAAPHGSFVRDHQARFKASNCRRLEESRATRPHRRSLGATASQRVDCGVITDQQAKA